MTAPCRIERTLRSLLARTAGPDAPPKLAAALEYALFPGGARVRPQLALAVATACGDDAPVLSEAAAAALELMHCASLVHDDLPCFDDAALRRTKPSVHRAFDEPIAVLTGDAMIVLAYDVLGHAGSAHPQRALALVRTLAAATGAPRGICAGQAWESEEDIDLELYHQSKTGALFVAATTMGAMAAGSDPGPWRALGKRLGEAYQVADDLRDVLLTTAELGKPAGQDHANHRPSAVSALGISGARDRLDSLLRAAVDAIPACPGDEMLRALVLTQAKRLSPSKATSDVA